MEKAKPKREYFRNFWMCNNDHIACNNVENLYSPT